ncbi:MAG: ferritin family protein [candidate division Zixibacteria bacterium]|nr:ferritin family protein [candidate division Zixibacteria bacterium]
MSDIKDFKSILEPLRIALKLEIEGKQFFLEAASTTKSRLARQTFEFLAAEEDRHIEQIENMCKSVEGTDGKDLLDAGVSDADQKLVDFNNKLAELKDEIAATGDDTSAYSMALKFENGAEEFYEKMMNESDNPRVKKFYKWLIEEEEMHSRLLKSCIKFIDNPADWFKSHKPG